MSSRVFMFINLILSTAAIGFLFWLLYLRHGGGDPSSLSFLPAVNASLNAATALCLVRGYLAIRSGNRLLHAFSQKSAFVCSSLFLACYIIYHAVHGDSLFHGIGLIRPVYFFILISHISLSVIALPMILATFFFALSGKLETHKKWAKLTLPIWLYVSITGVLIFALLKAYA